MTARSTPWDVLKRCEIREGTTCVAWRGAHNTFGRPRVRYHGRKVLVARLVLEFLAGPPPDESSRALHSCDTEWCVNPGHLRWGSQSENTAEMWERSSRATPLCPHGGRKWKCRECKRAYMSTYNRKAKP